ncbi:hypothetical protein [Chlorogloeopsis sp. ULAP02]|uniref:hypothetical protein n=1 Tax=Chlorogloeopsis sp. ULAP02 TaxID=3107926 RepID=UPI0031369034
MDSKGDKETRGRKDTGRGRWGGWGSWGAEGQGRTTNYCTGGFKREIVGSSSKLINKTTTH